MVESITNLIDMDCSSHEEYTMTYDKYSAFINNENVNELLIAGETQAGKTDAIFNLVENSLLKNMAVIITTANRKDQRDQLVGRIGTKINIAIDRKTINPVKLIVIKAENQWKDELADCIKNNILFVLVFLDNESTIDKVRKELSDISYSNINQIMLIHDEGDLTFTDPYTGVEERKGVAKAQIEWNKTVMSLRRNCKKLKRAFVTATGLCVSAMTSENIAVVVIKPKDEYKGLKDIRFLRKDGANKFQYLRYELSEIKKENKRRVVLELSERTKNEHVSNLYEYTEEFSNDFIIHTYNGDGCIVYCGDNINFKQLLVENILKCLGSISKVDDNIVSVSNITIAELYSIFEKIDNRSVLTIGKELIQRGISFVSSSKDNPLAAASMIYLPNTESHHANIIQTLGRVTGNARPDLKRRVYCTNNIHGVVRRCITFNESLKNKFEECANDGEMDFEFECPVPKQLDRPKINKAIKPIVRYVSRDELVEMSNTSEEIMKRCINLWWGSENIIGKILRYIYAQTTVQEQQLKTFIRSCGSIDPNGYYGQLNWEGEHKFVFTRNGNITGLTNEAKCYIESLI